MTAETVWQGRYITVRKDGTWEYVDRAEGLGAAVIIAVTDAEELILIEEYRVPLGRSCLGFPAGIVGDDVTDEEPVQSARRELEEETGYRAARMDALGSFASSPGLTSETFTLFRAGGLTKTGDGGGVDGEDIIVHLVPIRAVPIFIEEARERGLAIDVKLIACLRLL
ncbi:NUDIX hydrolase [Pacificimonas sp. WHA3]|uniref:GDP-mannose pyrophosphatase n=1 Tax=Pacificimonas pallii TaxID=2827236 RepID=A0ABS6SCZ1_9SPHN|nr:NUDIX hydrolase [Pacificimonas pallii]MBV7255791.1 NUDIX hydrolase [Pacificimonas pallii]